MELVCLLFRSDNARIPYTDFCVNNFFSKFQLFLIIFCKFPNTIPRVSCLQALNPAKIALLGRNQLFEKRQKVSKIALIYQVKNEE